MEHCGKRIKRRRSCRFKEWRVRPHLYATLIFFFFFCIFTKYHGNCTANGLPSLNSGGGYLEGDDYNGFQGLEKKKIRTIINGEKGKMGGARRLLGGPGSFPPRCNSKCGRCTPCKPVHVPVPPGTPVTTEYYPEAWRCKCGNKLFMP